MILIRVEGDGTDRTLEAAELWRAMTPELRDGPLGGDKKGSRGDPLAQKCRNVVAAQLSMLHPNEAFLFIGKIPKMLAQQGIDGYQQPEHLASDTVGTTGTITLNEPERKALQRIVARHPLDGFEKDLVQQIIRRYGGK